MIAKVSGGGAVEHVVLISLDTLRTDGISACPTKLWPIQYGLTELPRASILDELAATGAYFPNCITAAPYTSAAHASVFTGRWPLRHGVYEFFNRRLTTQTLFGRAQRLGYTTISKVDFPLILGPWLGFDRHFDVSLIEDDDRAIDAIAAATRSVSFVHFGGLHVPYGFHSLRFGGQDYINKVAELEANAGELGEHSPDELTETYRTPEDMRLLLRYKRAVHLMYQQGKYAEIFRHYLDGITYFLEHRFAPFYRRLLRALRGQRYVVVLFGDHGEEYDAVSFGHFNTVAEGVVRVPLLFSGSGVRPGAYRRRVRTVDICPTVLELLGDREAWRLRPDGSSLVPTVVGGAEYPERDAFTQTYTAETEKFVRYQKRLLALGRKTGAMPHQLYREAAYTGAHKLTRQHLRYEHMLGAMAPCPPEESLERFDDDGVPRPDDDLVASRRLRGMLADYNALRRSGPSVRVTKDIRADLRAMGYRV